MALLVASCADSLSAAEIQEQKAAARQLIDALDEYRSDIGHYPEALTDLSPDYIAVVPSPPLDEAYGYRLERSDQEYWLGFSTGRNKGCGWFSFFELWDCTPGHP